MSHDKGRIGIYVHWPFCLAKCPYCDFNSHVREVIDQAAWREAYLCVLRGYAARLPGRVLESVFFGGGTPSLMAPETAGAILAAMRDHWEVAPDLEVTLEANPTSVESDKLRAFRLAGVNRVSLGIQALNDRDLRFLGRKHNVKEAIHAFETAKEIFDRYSFDLIYARPQQSLKDWEQELEMALQYAGGHLSLYQLTIERNTPFYMAHAQGQFSIPEEGLAADFYDLTQDVLARAGLPAYEVSNHARPGQESRHNLIYWRYGDYIGIGPGAHGRLTIGGMKYATREHSAPEIWLEKAPGGHAAHPDQPLTGRDRFLEALMMGLRLVEGVSLSRLEREAGQPLETLLADEKMLALEQEGWLERRGDILRLKRGGMLRLNAVLPYILKHAA